MSESARVPDRVSVSVMVPDRVSVGVKVPERVSVSVRIPERVSVGVKVPERVSVGVKFPERVSVGDLGLKVKVNRRNIGFLHLHEIVEELYFHFSLSVCVRVSVRLSVC